MTRKIIYEVLPIEMLPILANCLLNTSCDHQLHLDYTNTSPELQDHSIVGSAESESILNSEDLLQLDSISVSPQATCNFETESLLNSRDNWMTSTRSLLTLQAQSQPLSKLPGMTHTTLSVQMTQWQSSATNTLTLVTTQHYPNFWHTTIVRTWIPVTLQVQYQPLSKLPNIVPITLLQARLRKQSYQPYGSPIPTRSWGACYGKVCYTSNSCREGQT